MVDGNIPIVFYNPNGDRVLIGSAKIEGGEITGTITNPTFAKIVSPEILPGEFSLTIEPAVEVIPTED